MREDGTVNVFGANGQARMIGFIMRGSAGAGHHPLESPTRPGYVCGGASLGVSGADVNRERSEQKTSPGLCWRTYAISRT